MASNIKVVCRFRPVNKIELVQYPPDGKPVVQFADTLDRVMLTSASMPTSGPEAQGFSFDRVFPMGTQQAEVFEYGVRGIVDDVIAGYNGTVFAYGQTGSGKTFTMMGSDIDDPELKGIIPRITEQIFEAIMTSPPNIEYLVKVSYMEIYMERIRDLLAPQKDNLQVHEDKVKGVYVKGLTDYYVSNTREVYEIMRQGGQARVVSSTNMNAESSRSHSIFLISIEQKNTDTGSVKTGNLFLVDLAGSEKIGKTGATGQTLEEAKKINKSLSALGMVINALTDGKSSHIPYRDSKLTRILQESLGGNSRTTLIINCSPSDYNEAETLSTLRFGMRAKSIKNKARVNAELSPAELKALLKKAQRDKLAYEQYISAMEAELALWRAGKTVPKEEWATSDNAAVLAAAGAAASKRSSGTTTPGRPASALSNPALEGLREAESRPMTPTPTGLDKDERDDFLKREGELNDQLAEKEHALAELEKIVNEIKTELEYYKKSADGLSKENASFRTELSDLRLNHERLQYEQKDTLINLDVLRDKNVELTAGIEELGKALEEAKAAQRDSAAEDLEKKKAEKMAQMMAKFEATGFSDKDDELRAMLAKLDGIDSSDSTRGALTSDDLAALRRHLIEGQTLARETQEKLRKNEEENEALVKRKDEVEARLHSLEAEYEELLEKSIADEEAGHADIQESIAAIKEKLEAQYSAKREKLEAESLDLRQLVEHKNTENKDLGAQVKSLQDLNDELKRAFAVTSAGIEGGKNLAESARELERTRKGLAQQLADFEGMKKSLMRDLQNRCEKVVELEIELDQYKEQYNTVLRSTNNKAQQKKMAFLERNLEQLTVVQKGLVEQNTQLKKEVAVAERKLLARAERVHNLEGMLRDSEMKLEKKNRELEDQMNSFRERVQKAHLAKEARSAPGLNFGRIAKPLRGGGAAGPTAPPTPSGANPLARVAEDGSASNKRASWFFSGK